MREAIVAAVSEVGRPRVLARRQTIDGIRDGVRQVLVYQASSDGDVSWIASELARHPDLRVVYISLYPWADLSYVRARCVIAPPSPKALDARLLQRLVAELLSDD